MTIIRIDHVQITIPGGAEEEARRFYCGLLELHEIEKPAALKSRGGFWLQVGDMQVHVGTENGAARSGSKAHVAYEVNDLCALRNRLREAAIVFVDCVPLPGCDRFEVRDPFGNRVEFLQPS
jgi:catechol 2,3-dioxygenase-like lactoylglutathione lyase family enzyme